VKYNVLFSLFKFGRGLGLGLYLRHLASFNISAKNRSTNPIFGKVGRITSEEVTLQLVKSKCLPILLYGIECYSLPKADLHILLTLVIRFLMTLFRTANKHIIDECRSFCNFPLPTEMLEIKSNKFCQKFKCNKSMLRYFNISVS